MKHVDLLTQFDDETRECASLYVDGFVQGEKCEFLLDTAAAKTTLKLDTFSALLASVGAKESSGVFGRATYDLVKIESLNVGAIQTRDIVISRAMKGGVDRNLLGMDVLKDFCLYFKFREDKIILDRGAMPSLRLQELFVDSGFIPYVPVQCGSKDGQAVWDTGASVTLADINFVAKNPEMFEKLGSSMGTDSTGTSFETPTFLMKALTIGGESFAPHKIVGVDLSHVNAKIERPMDFILGYSTLRQADWIFDFPNRQWGVSKLGAVKS
jgi:hypothetical protein